MPLEVLHDQKDKQPQDYFYDPSVGDVGRSGGGGGGGGNAPAAAGAGLPGSTGNGQFNGFDIAGLTLGADNHLYGERRVLSGDPANPGQSKYGYETVDLGDAKDLNAVSQTSAIPIGDLQQRYADLKVQNARTKAGGYGHILGRNPDGSYAVEMADGSRQTVSDDASGTALSKMAAVGIAASDVAEAQARAGQSQRTITQMGQFTLAGVNADGSVSARDYNGALHTFTDQDAQSGQIPGVSFQEYQSAKSDAIKNQQTQNEAGNYSAVTMNGDGTVQVKDGLGRYQTVSLYQAGQMPGIAAGQLQFLQQQASDRNFQGSAVPNYAAGLPPPPPPLGGGGPTPPPNPPGGDGGPNGVPVGQGLPGSAQQGASPMAQGNPFSPNPDPNAPAGGGGMQSGAQPAQSGGANPYGGSTGGYSGGGNPGTGRGMASDPTYGQQSGGANPYGGSGGYSGGGGNFAQSGALPSGGGYSHFTANPNPNAPAGGGYSGGGGYGPAPSGMQSGAQQASGGANPYAGPTGGYTGGGSGNGGRMPGDPHGPFGTYTGGGSGNGGRMPGDQGGGGYGPAQSGMQSGAQSASAGPVQFGLPGSNRGGGGANPYAGNGGGGGYQGGGGFSNGGGRMPGDGVGPGASPGQQAQYSAYGYTGTQQDLGHDVTGTGNYYRLGQNLFDIAHQGQDQANTAYRYNQLQTQSQNAGQSRNMGGMGFSGLGRPTIAGMG